MHKVYPSVLHEPAKATDPSGAPSPLEAVDWKPRLLEVIHESVVVRKKIRDLVLEAASVQVRRLTDQELLGSAPGESLDQVEDALHDASSSL